MSRALTDRQKEILTLIADYMSEKGYAPTYQELADHLNIKSKYAILKHIDSLVKKGYLEKDSSARTIRITHPDYAPENAGNNACSIPLVGRVAAGFPVLAEENVERYISIPRAMIKAEGRYYALKVRGDSMVKAGIFENDLVVVQSGNKAYNRDIIVALVEDEVTVKRFIKENGSAYLKAENDRYPDIHPRGDWSIQGKVVGLIREMMH
ncbi:MAG: transcriptional repressor LexA [Calditrichaeota bacterium]|nr:MAG: transcriptional repressor LexA [Calditrichota bacterium]